MLDYYTVGMCLDHIDTVIENKRPEEDKPKRVRDATPEEYASFV